MNADLDMALHPALRAALEQTAGYVPSQIAACTLEGDAWCLTASPTQAPGRLRWVLRRQRTVGQRHDGYWLQACPACLAEGVEPYFRKHWRFAFFTECIVHACALIDCCHGCGASLDYLAEHKVKPERLFPLSYCAACGNDWRTAPCTPSPPQLVQWQRRIGDGLVAGWVRTDECPALIPLYLDGIHALQRLLRDQRGASLTRAVQLMLGGIVDLAPGLPIERLSVKARRSLLSVAAFLCEDWPQRLIEWSRHCRTRFGYDRGMGDLPYWLGSIVQAHLSHAWQSVTREEREAAAAFLKRRGLPQGSMAVRAWTGGWANTSLFGQIQSLEAPWQLVLPGWERESDRQRLKQHFIRMLCGRLRAYCRRGTTVPRQPDRLPPTGRRALALPWPSMVTR